MADTAIRKIVAGAALAAIAAMGCSSGSTGAKQQNGATTTTAADVLLGTKKPVSGAPVKIGFMYAGKQTISDGHNELEAAKGTIRFVNEYLGGIAGRPVELDICEDHSTPAGASDCANQMVTDKVPLVLAAGPAQPAPILDILKTAKIPLMIEQGGSQSEFFAEFGFVAGNPLGFLATPLRVKSSGRSIKKIAMIRVDVPAAASIPTLAKPIYAKAGIDFSEIKVPLATPDVTPQVQAAMSGGADTLFIIGDDSLCVTTLKAAKSLGFKGTVFGNKNCLKVDSAKSIQGFQGFYLSGAVATGATDPEVKLFHAVMAHYAPNIKKPDDGTVPENYAVIVLAVRALTNVAPGSEITAASTYASLLSMKPQTVPLLANSTFQCDRKRSALLPAVCSNASVVETIDGDGVVTKTDAFDATPFLP